MKQTPTRRPPLWLVCVILGCLLLAGGWLTEKAAPPHAIAAAPLTPAHRRISTSRRIRQGDGWVTRRTLTYIQDGRWITVTWEEAEPDS